MLKSLLTKFMAMIATVYGSTILFSQKVLAQTYYNTGTTTNELTAAEEAQLATFLAAYAFVLVIVVLVFYVYYAFCLMKVAQKLNVENPWMAWVPLLNIYLETKCAGVAPWMMILYFIPIVNSFVMIYFWYKIAERRGFNPLIALGLLVPIVGVLVFPYVAFAKNPSGN